MDDDTPANCIMIRVPLDYHKHYHYSYSETEKPDILIDC